MRPPLYLILICFCALLSCQKKSTPTPLDQSAYPDAPEDMVYLPGGTYTRGSDGKPPEAEQEYPEESPPHRVTVSPFFIDTHEVTNAQFKKFTDATGYQTQAELGLSKEDFPLAPPEMLLPGAMVFKAPAGPTNLQNTGPIPSWWNFIPHSNWRQPEGPDSNINDRLDHPVTCLAITDAQAYAKWAGKRLPTEAEWEYAARGGLENKHYSWGNERRPNGKTLANVFQGEFPNGNTAKDGFKGTAPVGSFPPNGYGLYDMAGNVWEICSDYFRPDTYKQFIINPHPNPTGPAKPITQDMYMSYAQNGKYKEMDPNHHPLTNLHITKGGSYLCSENYCLRYRPAARHFHEPLSPTNHSGFRCVKDLSE